MPVGARARDISTPSTIPTWSRLTSLTSRWKPGRPSALVPERPRSSSITSTRSAAHPNPTARSARPYCNRVDSWCSTTCCGVDWRTYTTASRSRCHGSTFPERSSRSGAIGPVNVAVMAPSSPRPRHRPKPTFQQLAQQPHHAAAVRFRQLPPPRRWRGGHRWAGARLNRPPMAAHLPQAVQPGPPAASQPGLIAPAAPHAR